MPKHHLKFNSNDLELVDNVQYLGVSFQSNGLLKQSVKLLSDKALKAHIRKNAFLFALSVLVLNTHTYIIAQQLYLTICPSKLFQQEELSDVH